MSITHRVFFPTHLQLGRSLRKQTPQSLSPRGDNLTLSKMFRTGKCLGNTRLWRQEPSWRGLGMGETESGTGNAGCEIYSRMKTIHKSLQGGSIQAINLYPCPFYLMMEFCQILDIALTLIPTQYWAALNREPSGLIELGFLPPFATFHRQLKDSDPKINLEICKWARKSTAKDEP